MSERERKEVLERKANEFMSKLRELKCLGEEINDNTIDYMGCGSNLKSVIKKGNVYIANLICDELS